MLYEVTGDILLSRAAAIAHGVSPDDNFHQGLALSLREQWPALYQDFRHYCKTQKAECGSLWTWAGADGRRIVNLFTQDPPRATGGHPGRATVQHVGHALKKLHALAEKEKLASLALPRLATGVGGLEWTAVQPLLQQHLGSLPIPVYVYTRYEKGVAAKEPGVG
ncbi:MAG: macro domain-containing protein [Gammaproteobacteria bacterium]|nr:macro domain-containing protein [Gammaproteobacteria bacterium]